MLTTLVLSADSLFAGAILRFCGMRRKQLSVACLAIGMADAVALLAGHALQNSILAKARPSDLRILFVVCGLASMLLGHLSNYSPRVAIPATAVLFSIDNLLAGAGIPSFASAAVTSGAVALFSSLAGLMGFNIVDAIAGEVSRRAAVTFALLVAVTCSLFF